MARARNVKPGFFRNEDLAECSIAARLLFVGMWTLADREGRLPDRPRKIKFELCPTDDFDGEEAIAQLTARGFLHRYTAAGEGYIQIVNWGKHQSPHIKEQASTIPAPDMPDTCPVQADDSHPLDSLDSLDCLIPEEEPTEVGAVAPPTEPAAPDELERWIDETATQIEQAAFVADDHEAVCDGVRRAFGLVHEFPPRAAPALAALFAGWKDYRKKPPDNWYLAWIRWMRKELKDSPTAIRTKQNGHQTPADYREDLKRRNMQYIKGAA